VNRGNGRGICAAGDEHLRIVATGRICAFDVILPDAIPGKGPGLTAVSEFWLDYFGDTVANQRSTQQLADYLCADEIAQVSGRAMLVKKLDALPIEAVVRGYVIGSGWKGYQATGSVCGVDLPAGLQQAEQLEQPIFTPATKAEFGDHDENISFDTMVGMIGSELAQQVREVALSIYRRAAAYARERGIIVADTKLEFGTDAAGNLVLIDEVVTPDSSSFWP